MNFDLAQPFALRAAINQLELYFKGGYLLKLLAHVQIRG